MRPREASAPDLHRSAVCEVGRFLALDNVHPVRRSPAMVARAGLSAAATLTADALAVLRDAAPDHVDACRAAAAAIAAAALALRSDDAIASAALADAAMVLRDDDAKGGDDADADDD